MDVIYIGDEVTAAGLSLAGAEVRTPAPSSLETELARALKQAELVIVSAQYTAHLRHETVARLAASVRPPVLLLPDMAGTHPGPDLIAPILRGLGIGKEFIR